MSGRAGFEGIGFRINGIKEGKYGLCIIEGQKPCALFGVFTSNNVKAAPVLWDKKLLGKKVRAIAANSGCANAFTGKDGEKNAEGMAGLIAEKLGIKKTEVAIASTGVIGVQLDLEKIKGLAEKIDLDNSDTMAAAQAIMTTDRFPKVVYLEREGVKLAAICKGAGMISPNMATMLCFIGTNAKCTQKELENAVEKTFNTISVDGDMSTNDTVLLLSTGEVKSRAFPSMLEEACLTLAKLIMKNAEGASKVFEVRVKGAKSLGDARKAARAIVNSPLVKTAVFGADPNYGRIVAALGYSGAKFSKDFDLAIVGTEKIFLVKDGVGAGLQEQAGGLMKAENILFELDLKNGKSAYTAYGCDLTYEYVKENASYTS